LQSWQRERNHGSGSGGGGGGGGSRKLQSQPSIEGGLLSGAAGANRDPDADYTTTHDSDGSVELTGMDHRGAGAAQAGCMPVGSTRAKDVRVVVKSSTSHGAHTTVQAAAAAAFPLPPEVMIDGYTLVHVFGDNELEALFAEVAELAGSVIVCRSSPRQKAAVVRVVKEYRKARRRVEFGASGGAGGGWLRRASAWLNSGNRGKILAIGDGANDCAMITMADLGVGIKGREGRQAANQADYSIAQFSHLRRLLLLHGHLSQYRLSRLIRFSFYKNIQFAALLFYYQFLCGFSGQALYDSITAAAYNVLLTALPVLLFALLDQPMSAATLLAEPWLYSAAPRLTYGSFWKSVWDSVLAAAVCFYFSMLAVTAGDQGSNAVNGLWVVGKTAFTATLITVNLEIALVSRHWTWPFALALVLSVAVWFPILTLVPQWFTYYEVGLYSCAGSRA
jgi:phospholipid-transporting ATPase